MRLPVVFHILGLSLPAHAVMESLAYLVGWRLYVHLRRRSNDPFDDKARFTVLIGAVVGAAIGSKVLAFLEHPELWPRVAENPAYLIASKTILGGLLGGIIGVEVVKKIVGIKRSTGDIYVFPLLIAIMIGRVGCLLTGVSDGTWGDATRFFMAYDAGDGVMRHPTPLYEILFLASLACTLWFVKRQVRLEEGALFKIMIMAYCAWRFLIEFIKPVTTYAFSNNLNIVQNIATPDALAGAPGLSILQISALAGLAIYAAYFMGRYLGDDFRRRV